jgi:hypothetical protein
MLHQDLLKGQEKECGVKKIRRLKIGHEGG